MAETVTVSRKELAAIRDELDSLRKELDGVGRLRLEAARLRARIEAMLAIPEQADELTPVNPPSADAIKQAFESSSSFMAVKPPKRKP